MPGFLPTDHGFDSYFGLLYSNDMMPPWVNTERPLQLYRDDIATDEAPVDQRTLTERYTEAAVQFIRSASDGPFFLYLAHSMPHLPIYASEDFVGRSRGGRYGDVIEELDASAGRVLDALDAAGVADNTLVLFTSDNGPWRNMPPRMHDTEAVERWDAGSTGPLRGAKATTYEGGVRVPAILRWPGRIPGGQVRSEIVTTMDVYPTVLRLAGAPLPEAPLDGLDVWAMLSEGGPSPHQEHPYFWMGRLEAIRDDTWKLRIAPPADDWLSPEVAPPAPVLTELFDLREDPYERFDVSEAHPEIVTRMRERMAALAAETGAALWFEP